MADSYSGDDSDDDGYESQNAGLEPNDDEDSEYPTANEQGFQDEEFQQQRQDNRFADVASRARQAAQNKLKGKIGNKVAGKLGLPENLDDTPENRERLKKVAARRARRELSKRVGDKIGDEGFKKGFQKGLSKDPSKLAREGLQKARTAAKDARAAAQAAKGAKTAATAAKAAKTGATAAKGIQAGIVAAGAASGPETLGLGFVVSLLLSIAIGLGIGDAIDCLFEIKNGNLTKARFHAYKAAMLILMFMVFLVAVISCLSVIGLFTGIPLLILLNIYTLLGLAFPSVGLLQGFSRKWEIALLLLIDLFVIIIFLTFMVAIMWYVCDMAGWVGVGTGVGSVVAKVVDWWTGTDYATFINDTCKSITSF